MTIEARLSEVYQAIQRNAPDRQVKLVAVSKYATLSEMVKAHEVGIRHFGENKVQDALSKIDEFPLTAGAEVHWHLIGNIQSNKVKKTVGRFDLIHSVDSVALGELLSRHNLAMGQRQKILLQVNLSEDPDRHGFPPALLANALEGLICLEGIRIEGLMGIAPPEISLSQEPSAIKRVFSGLFDLKAQMEQTLGISLPELSMGMSDDYIHALSSGATIIRLGNYLFKN